MISREHSRRARPIPTGAPLQPDLPLPERRPPRGLAPDGLSLEASASRSSPDDDPGEVIECDPPLRAAPVAALTIRWGRSAPNRLADRAGRYRRLAVALALVPAPLVVMALAAVIHDAVLVPYAAGHVFLAGACGWMACDLVRRASVLDGRSWPAASTIAVLGGLVVVVLASLQAPTGELRHGAATAVVPAVLGLAIAFAILVVAERSSDRLLSLAGRWAMVIGGGLLGGADLVRTFQVYPEARSYAAGLGLLACLLTMTAMSEARLLLRGAALARLAASR